MLRTDGQQGFSAVSVPLLGRMYEKNPFLVAQAYFQNSNFCNGLRIPSRTDHADILLRHPHPLLS